MKNSFHVVIVGGSISGLTLAHCLRRAKIDFVVLESRSEIAPQEGASIGMLATGSQVLDQLGILDAVLAEVAPAMVNSFWTGDGRLIACKDTPWLLQQRHGYPASFLDRQRLLEILYERLEAKSRVLVNKKVTAVEHTQTGVVVRCSDGSQFEGDLVVGADGIRSTIRQEMWKHMESVGRSRAVEREKAKLKSEYTCVFGISTATPGLEPGQIHRTFMKGASTLVIVGKNSRVFWFLFTRAQRTYSAADLPRFSPEDLKANVSRYRETPVAKGVSLEDVYRNVVKTAYVPLEEAFYEHWTCDRFVCVGDSMHKMTPNLGLGANTAIESVAALVNHLNAFVSRRDSQGSVDALLRRCLAAWEQERQPRAKVMWEESNAFTRVEALESARDRLVARVVLPYMHRFQLDRLAKGLIGAETLDFLPTPKRSLECSIPYDKRYRKLYDEPFWKRAVWALPLVLCCLWPLVEKNASGILLFPHLFRTLDAGVWRSPAGDDMAVDLNELHWLLRPILACFSPSLSGSDLVSRLQMLSFLADLGPLYAIWLLEKCRRCHHWSAVFFPVIWSQLYQFLGIGKLAPIYFLVDYLQSPLTAYLMGRDAAAIRSSTVIALFLAILLVFYPLTWASYYAPELVQRVQINAVWQFFPVLVALLHWFLMMFARRQSPPQQQRKKKKTRPETKYITLTITTLATISAATFQYIRFSAPDGLSLFDIFFPSDSAFVLPPAVEGDFDSLVRAFLQYDQICSVAAAFVWLLLSFRDLQTYGCRLPWIWLLGGLVFVTCVGGPGAAFGLGWVLREVFITT